MANRVIPPHRRDPDDSHDSQYYRRGVDDIRNVITSTTEPLDAEPGTLWYNPEGVPEYGVDIGISKDDADSLYASKVVETAVARVDPGEYAGAVGESLAQGPSGPAWKRDAVSADWYSNPNDAITAAGPGGTVEFTAGAVYTLPEPLRLIPGIQVRGGVPFHSRSSYSAWGEDKATVLRTSGFSAFEAADPMDTNLEILIAGLVIDGQGTSPIGIDFRGIGHSRIEHVAVRAVTDCGIWLGGDSSSYNVSWSNTLTRPLVFTPENGSGIRFKGLTGNGAPNANNTLVQRAMIYFRGPNGKGIDLQDGDTNLVMQSDIGYRPDGIPIYLGNKSRQSTFLRNRTENVSRSVLIEDGRHHTFIANLLAGDDPDISPVVITAGFDNMFYGNKYSENARTPRIDGSRLYYKSQDIGEQTWFRDTPQFINGGGVAFEVKAEQHSHKTFDVRGDYGVLEWFNRSTGDKIGEFRPINESGAYFTWMDGMAIQVPRVTSLPAAASNKRGVMFRVEGATGVADGIYICVKQENDTYAWKQVTLT